MKKTMKKFASLALALIMALALAVPAFADENTVNITLPDADVLAGHDFVAYQIFTGTQNAENDNELANVAWGNGINKDAFVAALATSTKLTKDDAPIFNVNMTAAEVAKALGGIANNSEQANEVAQLAYTHRIKENGTPLENGSNAMPRGYYLIVDETEDVGPDGAYNAALLQVTNTVTISVKTDAPTLEKKIDENGTQVDYNNGAIGDEVKFVLNSAVPNHMEQYEKYFFVVNDTLSPGLTVDMETFAPVVKLGEKTLKADEDYTVDVTENNDGSTSIKIVFKNFIQYANEPEAAIVINYSAFIDTDAVIGVEGNPNTANLIYSNNPNYQGDGEDEPDEDDPVGKTPDSETRTYVTEIELRKVDENGNALVGAEFKLTGTKLNTVITVENKFTEDENGTYWKLKDGTYTTTDPETEGMNQDAYASTTTKYKLEEVTKTVTKPEAVEYRAFVGPDGIVKFRGLAAGDYKIEEVTTPDGYNTIAANIELTIGWKAPTTGTDCTWTINGSNQKDSEGKELWTVSTDGKFVLSVVNHSGGTLPETGGIGTTIFTVVGGVLVVGAAVLLVVKKRVGTAD